MKKNKKKIIALFIVICVIVSICLIVPLFSDKSALKDSYNNSKVNKSVSGYNLDLRIYGSVNKKYINKSFRITNYRNTDIMIENLTDNVSYARYKNKTYILSGNKYEEAPLYNKYQNPNIYMDGIDNSSDVKFMEEKTVSGSKYKIFSLKFDKDYVNDVIKEVDAKIPSVSKDISGDVWLDSENRVYKVYYYIDNVTIYASYFGYNMTSELNLFGTEV